jgi:hypothetical protein
VGHRIAFDGERGRLWVVCERCRRWNLSPLDERWEAIEECERTYRDTPESFSTDNIGLARLGGGLELVRIGRPQRREFAAWRYGRQFLRRRIKTLTVWGVKLGAMVAAAASGVFVFHLFAEQQERIVARIRSEDGRRLSVPLKDAKKARLIRAPQRDDGWMLSVPYRDQERNWGIFGTWAKGERKITELEGPVAIRAAGRIMPSVNSFGGSNSQVQNAVRLIEDARAGRAERGRPDGCDDSTGARDGRPRGDGASCLRGRAGPVGRSVARGGGGRCHRRPVAHPRERRDLDPQTSVIGSQ